MDAVRYTLLQVIYAQIAVWLPVRVRPGSRANVMIEGKLIAIALPPEKEILQHLNLYTCLLGYRYSFTHNAWRENIIHALYVVHAVYVISNHCCACVLHLAMAGWLSQRTLKYEISPLPLAARDWTTATIKLFQELRIYLCESHDKDFCCELCIHPCHLCYNYICHKSNG